MSVLRFQIQHANGRQEQISVEAERALVGSGAHCEIRLPLDQAAVEHVLVQVGAGGNVFVQALHFEPPPTIGGVPFTQAPLPPDAILGVGQSQMVVGATTGEIGGLKKKEQKASPTLMFGLILGLGFAVFLALHAQPDAEEGVPDKVPELFTAAATDKCDKPAEALPYAQQQMRSADGRRERRAFHIHDGVEAVPYYEMAAVCFLKGGDKQSYQDAADDAKALRQEMDDDYRTHRLRLSHAVELNDEPAEHTEARLLLDMLQGKQGPYVDYLNVLERRLKQKLGRSAS